MPLTRHNLGMNIPLRLVRQGKEMSDNLASEFLHYPEYVVNVVRTEKAEGGMIRAYAYTRKGGVLVPAYTALLTAQNTYDVGRTISQTALEIFREGNAPIPLMLGTG